MPGMLLPPGHACPLLPLLMCQESVHTGLCIRAVSDTHEHSMQGHSWGVANVTRKASSPSTWLIEASVAPARDDGQRLLQVRIQT